MPTKEADRFHRKDYSYSGELVWDAIAGGTRRSDLVVLLKNRDWSRFLQVGNPATDDVVVVFQTYVTVWRKQDG